MRRRRNAAANLFSEASAAASAATQSGSSTAQLYGLTCTGPVKYVGHGANKRDTENLTAAMRTTRAADAFTTAVSPATLEILPNAYHKSAEDYTLRITGRRSSAGLSSNKQNSRGYRILRTAGRLAK